MRPEDETIVAATIGLAHQLGLKVVAEGVENGERRDFLVRHGCKHLESLLFGRPQRWLPATVHLQGDQEARIPRV